MAETSSQILLIEDETEIRELMALHLLRQGYRLKECSSVEQGLEAIKENHFDLIVLDWMLPGLSGLDLVKSLRHQGNRTPILMVTAKVESQDIVQGLENGADDFLTKPFDPSVFIARVRAMLRRAKEVSSSTELPDILEMAGLKINTKTYEVQLMGQALHLTPSEFKLLVAMVLSKGGVLTRDQLIECIQGEGVNVIGRTVDTHVFGLRKKLGVWAERVETIRGIGYRVKISE